MTQKTSGNSKKWESVEWLSVGDESEEPEEQEDEETEDVEKNKGGAAPSAPSSQEVVARRRSPSTENERRG